MISWLIYVDLPLMMMCGTIILSYTPLPIALVDRSPKAGSFHRFGGAGRFGSSDAQRKLLLKTPKGRGTLKMFRYELKVMFT